MNEPQANDSQAQKKKNDAMQMAKIGGGVLMVCFSIGLFYKRMPSTKYVAVNVDKPRARPTPAAPAPAPAPSQPAPKAPAPLPAPKTPAPLPAAPGPGVLTAASLPVPGTEPVVPEKVELADACKAEVGVLCYEVPEEKLQACLSGYADVLMKECRTAMKALGAKLDMP